MTATTPPPLQGPTSKEKKYDRQLRLWAASGQAALEEAHILLINNGPGCVGVETLKNLVLPGIGHFTILDSTVVDEADLGLNFFLEDKSLGGLRAEQCCNYLKELNEDVQGSFITEPLESHVLKPDSFTPYTLILITAPVSPEILSIISEHASETATPVFYVHSVGFYSQLSVHLPPAFPIVDTHPDPISTQDLRLLKPWPALLELATRKTEGLASMKDDDHGHVPYVLILLHYLEEWKKTHEGHGPQNYKEKSEFREVVRKGNRTGNAEGGEENFEEAIAAVLKSLNLPSAGSAVKEVFAAIECKNITKDSANFWLIAQAISRFFAEHGVLPLPGSVPDMKARSADYIQLQNVYKSKAREDAAEVLKTVRELEQEFGRPKPVEEKEVDAFCKGAGYIKLVRGRPFHIIRPGKKVNWGDRAKAAVNALSDETSLILLHIALLAYDSYSASHTSDAQASIPRAPGIDDYDTDAEKMTGIAHTIIDDLINEAGTRTENPEYDEIKARAGKFCKELTRASGGELHNIAALTGGLVAQEVIKAVTKQYVPIDNTCMFDGVRSLTGVFRV